MEKVEIWSIVLKKSYGSYIYIVNLGTKHFFKFSFYRRYSGKNIIICILHLVGSDMNALRMNGIVV